jgi:hypothetical protein
MLVAAKRRDEGAKFCDRVVLDLKRPWRIDRSLRACEGQKQVRFDT